MLWSSDSRTQNKIPKIEQVCLGSLEASTVLSSLFRRLKSHVLVLTNPLLPLYCAALQQHEEARERWRSRLERLQEECSGERKTAREDVSRLSDRAEEAGGAARRAAGAREEELTGLRASLSAEYAQVGSSLVVCCCRRCCRW